jgi:thiamine transporter
MGAFEIAALGIAGIFRQRGRIGICLGIGVAIYARFISSVLSGAIVWQSVGELFGVGISNTWLYSLAYNGAYMLPELLITCTAAAILTAIPSFNKAI